MTTTITFSRRSADRCSVSSTTHRSTNREPATKSVTAAREQAMTITTTKRVFNLKIWGLALGYFAFYLPYIALVKATTSGVIPNQKEVSGFEMLPATLVATVVMMTSILAITGWTKDVRRKRVLGIFVPFPGKWTALSGLGTAVVIMTTTLAYSFKGVPIVLA